MEAKGRERHIGGCSGFSWQCQRFLTYCHFGVSSTVCAIPRACRTRKFMENGERRDTTIQISHNFRISVTRVTRNRRRYLLIYNFYHANNNIPCWMNIGYISLKWLTFMFSSIAFCINNLLHAKVSCNWRIQRSLLESYVLIVEESDFYEVIFFENEIIFHLTKQRLHSRLCYYSFHYFLLLRCYTYEFIFSDTWNILGRFIVKNRKIYFTTHTDRRFLLLLDIAGTTRSRLSYVYPRSYARKHTTTCGVAQM